jgi:nascent polypeptide-associated complex subunit alpha
MMDQMGMSIDEVSNVEQVSIRTSTREIVIDAPEVTLTRMQGQRIYQVVGGLVAQQAKVSMEKARVTLQQTDGDLAQAILILSQGTA